MGLKEVGVKLAKNGKVIANDDDTTSVPSIYAIGDVCEGRLELTPTAIRAGRFLAERLFKNQTRLMSYDYVATTVFTPIEYGMCGFSEEAARKKFGTENIVVYGESMKPFEWAFSSHRANDAFIKLIVNEADNERVVGIHFLGPNAG
jgi:thioredoxin reductase (NADPH)